MLCVDDAAGALSSLAQLLDLEVEVVIQTAAAVALSIVEQDGDFAVVICEANPRDMTGIEFLAAVAAVSPTSARVLVTEDAAREAASLPAGAVFRCISRLCSSAELAEVVKAALAYHQLLASCPAQPVESSRLERAGMLPPAKPAKRRSDMPVWKGFVDVANDLPSPVVIHVRDSQIPPAPPQSPARIGLLVGGRSVELLPGVTVVGRSRTCHIPIPDPRISRRHATFTNTGREVSVSNVSSTKGVCVNGAPLEGEAHRVLHVGDRIAIGSHEIEVCALGDYCPSFEPTLKGSLGPPVAQAPGLSTLVTLAQVADKYFGLGQTRDAVRILRPLLEGLLRHSRLGQAAMTADVELAVNLTLRIAEANRAGEWVDYIFALFSALERPMPADVVERVYRIIPESHGVSMLGFREYLETLGRIQERFGPSERFLLRRIQGLQAPLMMSAHV